MGCGNCGLECMLELRDRRGWPRWAKRRGAVTVARAVPVVVLRKRRDFIDAGTLCRLGLQARPAGVRHLDRYAQVVLQLSFGHDGWHALGLGLLGSGSL